MEMASKHLMHMSWPPKAVNFGHTVIPSSSKQGSIILSPKIFLMVLHDGKDRLTIWSKSLTITLIVLF